MGQSTNAILFFGFCWDEERHTPWDTRVDDEHDDDEEEDWETRYARLQAGITAPMAPYPERRAKDGYSTPKDSDYTPEELAIVNEHKAYWSAKRELAKGVDVQVDTHCSGDCPMPYVYITASRTISYRGDMNEITSLQVGEDWELHLNDFCKLMGIKTDGKPKWWLVSDWN